MEIKIPIELPDNWYDKVAEKLIEKGDAVLVTRCKDCKNYHPNYKQFESDKPYNRCEHPAQQFDIECYDMRMPSHPNCRVLFLPKGENYGFCNRNKRTSDDV